MEAARVKASREAADKIDWQRNPFEDPLKEWKKRNEAGNVNKLGYEDVPKGGIQVPLCSSCMGRGRLSAHATSIDPRRVCV